MARYDRSGRRNNTFTIRYNQIDPSKNTDGRAAMFIDNRQMGDVTAKADQQ